MKRFVWMILVCLAAAGCDDTNVRLATEAGVEAVRAVTLNDAQVRLLADRAAQGLDSRHRIAPPGSYHAERLARLTREAARDQLFDFKVYLAETVNAFALANGSIRIYSGLMDRMDDDELRFVIGHEMGHVQKDHAKRKLMVAYAASALRKGLASRENLAGAIASSALGGLVQNLATAGFSREEEKAADDAGLAFLVQNGFPEEAAADIASRALLKLTGTGTSVPFLASHPEPAKRAERIQAALEKEGPEGLWAGVKNWITLFWKRFREGDKG